ncbi:MAG: amidohydrolase family protein [Thermotogae bacterium]|nr:amidohydrolase family protein [Thermotogota bacterium]
MLVFSRGLIDRYFYRNVAVEVKGGRIATVEVEKERWNVSGVLIPGFVDTHAHFIAYALSLNRPRLDGLSTHEDALSFIRRKVEEMERNEVIIMEGYDDTHWGRGLSRSDLDRLTDRPLIVRRICGHKAVLNGAALRWLKERYGDVPGVDYKSGVAIEHLPLNLSLYVSPSDGEIDRAILKAEELAKSLGIVAIGENARLPFLRRLKRLDEKGKLKVRWRVAVYWRELKEAEELVSYKSTYFRVVGVKEFLDGSVGARTAALSFSYRDTSSQGELLHDDDYLTEVLEEAERKGLGVWFHAIGDRAIEQALRVISRSSQPYIHRIEHFLFPRSEHYRAAAALGVGVSVQPNFTRRWGRKGGLYQRAVGDALYWHNRFRTMENLGIKYAFGSDTMPPGPLYGIHGAINHSVADESLTLPEALYRYTTAGAELLGDGTYGRIEVGKEALLGVLCEEAVARR